MQQKKETQSSLVYVHNSKQV